MTAKQKKLFLLTSVMSVFVMAVTVLFAGGRVPTFKVPYAKANGSVSSVTFTRSDEYSVSGTTFKYKKSTPSGNDIYLVSTGGINRASNTALASVPSTFDTYNQLYLKFFKDSEATTGFMHQSISSLEIVTSGSITVKIQTSSDGISFKDKGALDCTTSGATLSSFTEIDRYICITIDSRAASTRSITSVGITYECEQGKAAPTVAAEYSTVVKDLSNRDSAVRMIFNSDGYGRLFFYNNTSATDFVTNYRWEYVPEKIAIKIIYVGTPPAGASISGASTGTAAQYQEYCLFVRYTTTYVIYNYVSLFEGKISLVFHTTTYTSLTNPDLYMNYNQRSNITVLNA